MTEEEIQKEIDEGPGYCKHCNGCGYTGCDGIKTFLEVHVKNKTNCEYEDMYLEDILQTYKILEEE